MGIEWNLLYEIQNLHNPMMDKLLVAITTLGNSGGIWILVAAILIGTKKYRKTGIHLAMSLILCLVLGNVLIKNLVARPRPCWIDPTVPLLIPVPTDYSFPSGHTFSGFASVTTLFYYKKSWGILAFILASLIAFSRLYLFVHFPTDILGGIILGVSIGIISKKIMDRSKVE